MRDKTPGSAGKRETASWKTGAFGPAISDYSAAREEEEDAALQERWAKTPDAQPMQKPGEEHEEKFLRFLRHHKLVPHDSSVETLQGLLEDENKQRTKELLDELHEKIKSNEDDTETYDDLRSYLTEAKPKDAEPTDDFGNTVEEESTEKKVASRSDVKRAKRAVEIKREGGIDTDLAQELAARGLYYHGGETALLLEQEQPAEEASPEDLLAVA
mmetsp:Transcript_13519/g.44145  ORF Transcript_13519/g.44145 Transcript_13519/m.44145 type:complete len:215 (+) Transcript_13519:63-707(+)